MYEIAKLVALVFGITGITLDIISVLMIFTVMITDSVAIERAALFVLGIGMFSVTLGFLTFLVPLLIYIWK